MRKLIFAAALGLVAIAGLSACHKQEDNTAKTEQAVPQKPSNPNDKEGWKNYLVAVVRNHLEGMTASRPYLYFVPSGNDDKAVSNRANQLSNVRDTVARTVVAGNLMAFGGPDSATTADFISNAFENAETGAFKGVIVLFIGDQADKQRVADAIKDSGATYRFVQM